MSDDWADGIIDDLADSIMAEFEVLAPQIVVSAQTMIGISVGRSGGRVIRSAPGEPPRKEYGDLQLDTQSSVGREGPIVEMSIFWTLDYAYFLNGGTSRGLAPRPFRDPLFEMWQTPIMEAIGQNSSVGV